MFHRTGTMPLNCPPLMKRFLSPKTIFSFFLIFLFFGCGEKQKSLYEEIDFSAIPTDVLANGEAVYARSCFACHTYGLNGAASLDDTKVWDQAAKKGIEILYQNVFQGYTGMEGVMPKKGNCWDCGEHDIRNAIVYMYSHVIVFKKESTH